MTLGPVKQDPIGRNGSRLAPVHTILFKGKSPLFMALL
jgi:hypothetical protein